MIILLNRSPSFFGTGHDESESLLRRNEGSNAKSILLDELDDEELSSLSLLFGGVGDGRHAFATLLDANHQYQSLSDMKQDKFRLHMTLNDIRCKIMLVVFFHFLCSLYHRI